MHAQKNWWGRTQRFVRALEMWLIVAILGGLILLGTAQILLRNVFSIGLSWGDGLARLAVLWLALLGGLAAARDGRHITMSGLARWLPDQVQRFAVIAADVVAAGVCAVLARYAWAFVSDSREFGDLLFGSVPAWWLQTVMPIAFALMAFEFVAHAVRRWLGIASPEGTNL